MQTSNFIIFLYFHFSVLEFFLCKSFSLIFTIKFCFSKINLFQKCCFLHKVLNKKMQILMIFFFIFLFFPFFSFWVFLFKFSFIKKSFFLKQISFKNVVFYIKFLAKNADFDFFYFSIFPFFSFWSFFIKNFFFEKKSFFLKQISFKNVVFNIRFLAKNADFEFFYFSIFLLFQFLKFLCKNYVFFAKIKFSWNKICSKMSFFT